MLRLVEVYIPKEKQIPEIMNTFTPEEKYLMIKIGCECLKEGRDAISKLSQYELTQQIKEEMKKDVVKLEMEILIERETAKRFEEKINSFYEKEKIDEKERTKIEIEQKTNTIQQLEIELNLEKERTKIKEIEKTNIYDVKINMLMEQIKTYETNFEEILKNKLRTEVDSQTFILEEKNRQIEKSRETFDSTILNYENEKEQLNKKINILNEQVKLNLDDTSSIYNNKLAIEREKNKYILDEKQKQVDKMMETYETILSNNNKSTSLKGSEGEKKFEEYADTFKDFKGFQFIDKHTKGGEGDAHLHFDEFNVLVDAKNYKKKVPVDQREKIKSDLLKNTHIQFGWLVSLNTSIDKFDQSPIIYDWINTKQCLVYINNLSSFEDPTKILRIVWFTCKELYKLIEKSEYDLDDLVELKEHKYMVTDKIKILRKNVKEANTSINTLKNVMMSIDDQLKYLLGTETDDIVKSNSAIFDDWWDENIELIDDDNITVNVTDLWYKYKQENKDILKEFELTVDKFKNYIKTKMPASSLVMKSKNITSAFDIKGIKLMDKTIEILAKKVKSQNSKAKYYFNEERDSKILNEYENDDNNNIFNISTNNSIKIFEVVSVLIRHKIINNRTEARGYDKYIETEEYQQKFSKKNDSISEWNV
jgi:hypothetical protein